MLAPRKKSCNKPRQRIKKQRHHFANKGPYSQSCDFSSGQVWIWELGHNKDWVPKFWFFQTVVLEKTLESLSDSKEIKLVNPKGNQPWIFLEGLILKLKLQYSILWPPDAKSWLTGKDPDAGKDWGQEEKEATEEEMVGWHHQLNGNEFEQIPWDSKGQGSLACCHSGIANSWTQVND